VSTKAGEAQIGNTGVAAWDGGKSLAVKLVVGTFKFYGTDNELRLVTTGSGLASPAWESCGGLRHLLGMDSRNVGSWVADVAGAVPLEAMVNFRCYFNRSQDVGIESRTWQIGAAADWASVDAALRAGEPQTGSMYVTRESVERLKEFLRPDAVDSSINRVVELLGRKQRTTPTHHAGLVLWARIPLDKLLSESPDDQVGLVRRFHSPVAGLLRRLSGVK